jgi:hypothetical protein
LNRAWEDGKRVKMGTYRNLTTKEKALQINLDSSIYGSFAEIGAGQEVAANFFKAGSASGTIAKTISAYDMTFSDAIYGQCERYVCEPRLMGMLGKEFNLLRKRLSRKADKKKFFAFADTVETSPFGHMRDGHGWIGLRFQTSPKREPNECIIHVHMLDDDNVLQQQTLGIVGVNLIYGCYFIDDPEALILSLMDDLTSRRIEIDMFKLEGPDFQHVDNRLMSLKLVKNGLTKAAMFGPDGEVLQPSEVLYKKNVLVLRGRFRPVTHVNIDMLLSGRREFKKDPDVDKKDILVISELTLQDLSNEGEIDDLDFLSRVDIICSLGQNVMISNYYEYYRLVDYLSLYTRKKKIGIILGFNNLARVFDETYYENLRGGILESFGTLFGHNVTLYVYPCRNQDSNEICTTKSFNVPRHLRGLFDYLMDNHKLQDVETANLELLDIISDNVLIKIQRGIAGWEETMPTKIALAIKEGGLFGYKAPAEQQIT